MPRLPKLTPETLQFVLLSFEGPDQYSMAGGLGVRMKELGLELARQGFNTHHIFIGDPSKPARSHPHKNLTLHRWCRWLSERHPLAYTTERNQSCSTGTTACLHS